MAFQFQPLSNPEIGLTAYLLPSPPYGTSYRLCELIEAYGEAVRDETKDSVDKPFQEVDAFKASSLSDVIAKFQIQLHYDNPGLDDDRLAVVLETGSEPKLLAAQSLLADLHAQLPQDWSGALRAYRAALIAELDYDRRIWKPGFDEGNAGGVGNSSAVEEEMERLQDIRANAEAFLLDMPAPSLAEFAIKYLICFDNDRDHNGWHETLCAEAKRLVRDSNFNDPEIALFLADLNREGLR